MIGDKFNPEAEQGINVARGGQSTRPAEMFMAPSPRTGYFKNTDNPAARRSTDHTDTLSKLRNLSIDQEILEPQDTATLNRPGEMLSRAPSPPTAYFKNTGYPTAQKHTTPDDVLWNFRNLFRKKKVKPRERRRRKVQFRPTAVAGTFPGRPPSLCPSRPVGTQIPFCPGSDAFSV